MPGWCYIFPTHNYSLSHSVWLSKLLNNAQNCLKNRWEWKNVCMYMYLTHECSLSCSSLHCQKRELLTKMANRSSHHRFYRQPHRKEVLNQTLPDDLHQRKLSIRSHKICKITIHIMLIYIYICI